MPTPRRIVLRPQRQTADDSERQQKLSRRRVQLQAEQQTLARWMTRLKRAFHAVEKQQRRVAHLERAIARLEQS